MTNKRERQATIRELVESQAISSQEDLRRLLLRRGWDVTQSTLSRDMRELRLARIPGPDGLRYEVSDSPAPGDGKATLDILLPALFARIDGTGELIVLNTVPGGAQPIAAALDAEEWPDVVGTIGGDDTILIICRGASARERISRRLRTLAGA
jgi:transcriptional regulator of arginine metabolism